MAAQDDAVVGVILPPPHIMDTIHLAVRDIAKHPQRAKFEERLRDSKAASDARFQFLLTDNPYHAYYEDALLAERRRLAREEREREQEKMAKDQEKRAEAKDEESNGVSNHAPTLGDATARNSDAAALQHPGASISAGIEAIEGSVSAMESKNEESLAPAAKKPRVQPSAPEPLPFLPDDLTLNSKDMDTIQLTALYASLSGDTFVKELSQREHGNPQFDFLHPAHSLHPYYLQMCAQFRLVCEHVRTLKNASHADGGAQPISTLSDSSRSHIIDRAWKRAAWTEYHDNLSRESAEDHDIKSEIARSVDWSDTVVVQALSFTEQDRTAPLAEPELLINVEAQPLAQRRLVSLMIAGNQDEVAQTQKTTAESSVDKARRELEHSLESSVPGLKLRPDYVPKALREEGEPLYTTYNDERVPVDEFGQRVKIDALDPNWVESKRRVESMRASSNLIPQGADPTAALKDLVAHRPDISAHPDQTEHTAKRPKVVDPVKSDHQPGLDEARRVSAASPDHLPTPRSPYQAPTVSPAPPGPTVSPAPPGPTVSPAPPGFGTIVPENIWLASHPGAVTVHVKLPVMPDKPQWGLDGSLLKFEHVPPTLLVGAMRDQIQMRAGVPAGRQRLFYNGRVLSNAVTLAGINFEHGATLVLALREDKKKK